MIISSDIIASINRAFQLINTGQNVSIRESERILIQLRDDISYPKVLFDYFQSYEPNLGLRAVIEFKLWFKSYSTFDDYKAVAVQDVVNQIKSQILQAYFTSQVAISNQILSAIISIAERDYPTVWPHFIMELDHWLLQEGCTLRAVKLLRKLTSKYSYASRSDALYEEIILTCNTIHNKFLILAQQTLQQITTNPSPIIYKIMKSILRIFYHLNFQDLHPSFEDNLDGWMNVLKAVLRLPEQGFQSDVFKCKGECLRSVVLYAVKYREDFAELIQSFSGEIYQVCTQTTHNKESEKIVYSALKYFKTLITWDTMKAFFESNLKVLMDSLIIKNIQLTSLDMDTFNEEPSTFIDTFFEQTDLESRRAQAIDLYKITTRHFSDHINQIIQDYLQQYVQAGMSSHADIVMINLLIDGGTVGFTPKDGAVQFQISPDLITGFYQACLKPKLAQIYDTPNIEQQVNPILLAFYCRYLFYFRNLIDKAELPQIALVISKLQTCNHSTLRQIAQFTIMALITVKTEYQKYGASEQYFNKVSISNQLQIILSETYNSIKNQPIGQYSLKLCISLITLLKQDVFNAIEALSDLFILFLNKVQEEYEFNNACLVFETIASVVSVAIEHKQVQGANILQQKILGPLDSMLRKNTGDVSSFIFQIYALLVQVQNNCTSYYQGIFNSLLDPSNWIEANVSLFRAYITFFQYWLEIEEPPIQQLTTILNIIVQIESASFTQLAKILIKKSQGWLQATFQIAFIQYQNNQATQAITSKSKATHLNQKLISREVFMVLSHATLLYGIQPVLQVCTNIQPGILDSFLTNELGFIKSVSRLDRKVVFVFVSQLLCHVQQVYYLTRINPQVWALVFNAVVENIYLKKKKPMIFYQLNFNEEEKVTSSSGFHVLKPILNMMFKLQIDEDQYFCRAFKTFYSDTIVQQTYPIAQIISQPQQELFSQLLQQE